MASQDNTSPSSVPEQPAPPSPPPQEPAPLAAAAASVDANGVEAPSDVESFHSGDEDFEAPPPEGKGADSTPAGGDGTVGKARDEVPTGGDAVGPELGGEALAPAGGGDSEAAGAEEVALGDVDVGDSTGGGGVVPGEADIPVLLPELGGEALAPAGGGAIEAAGAEEVALGDVDVGDSTGGGGVGPGEADIPVLGEAGLAEKAPAAGGAEGAYVVQGQSVAVDTEANGELAPLVGVGIAVEVADDGGKPESLVVPEPESVVPSESLVVVGGGSVEEKVEELGSSAKGSEAPEVDGAVRDSYTDGTGISESGETMEEKDSSKEDGAGGERAEGEVEQLGSLSEDPKAPGIDGADGEGVVAPVQESIVDAGTEQGDSSEVVMEASDRELVGAAGVGNGTMDAPPVTVQEENSIGVVDSGGDGYGDAMNLEEPTKVAVVDSSEAMKQLLKDLEEGGSPAGSSGVGSSRDFSQEIDGQVATDSDEEADTDEEGGGKELFDSAALAALLRAATGASPDDVTLSAPRVFTVEHPAGLGSSMPALRPGPTRAARLTPPTSSDLSVTGEPESNMDEEEMAMHEKVDQIRVKFLRLVHRLGHSAEDTVAAQVLYRLGLAEGIKRGRQTNRMFGIESAKRKALRLEDSGEEPLEFSCNILILGKTGVGKSSIINSILGEQVVPTNAFQPSTFNVKEITGMVDGVKIRFLDTPGLRPSIMDQNFNKKVLASIKKHTKRCPPDIVLYVDRLDTQTRDFNDLPLLRSIAGALGSSVWFNAIVALTHAASAPPDGPNGTPLGYEVFVAQRSHVVQHSIRQAAGDMRLMNPVALVENHPSCRRNREGQRVLPNGTAWKPQLLLLCYSSKTLSEANSLLKLQDPSPGKLFGFRMRSPPLPYLLSSLLQSRAYPKLSGDQGGDNGDSDIDLGDLSDSDHEDEDEYDQLPPFKPLRKAQIAMLSNEQKKAYFDEYDYRVKLLQKKQWRDELRRLREMKKRGKATHDDPAAYGDMADDYDQDGAPAAVPVPLPDMVLPPSFDCNNPAYRYRFLEPTSQLLARPVLDTHGWDHDCGYDGVSLEQSLAVTGQFPASVAVQITKDKKEFNVHLDSSIAAKLGENGSSLAGFDIQSVGKQLAYILRSEAKLKNLKKNRTAAGVSVTFLGENVVTGLKLEDQMVVGRRVCLVGSTGTVRSQGDVAYGANLEARLREKDYPVGQEVTTLGLSLMKWRRDLALGANFQTQVSAGRGSKMAIRVGLNNKLTGQFTVRTSTSDQLQIALLGIIPVAVSIYRTLWPSETY